MKTYVIRRGGAARSPAELSLVAERSNRVADSDYADEIRWIRSYVIAEEDDSLGTVCIYEATDPDAIRKHARAVGMPADEILEVADLVVNRPDPAAEAAAS
jgi:Nickel responsive protein SCO4226-like